MKQSQLSKMICFLLLYAVKILFFEVQAADIYVSHSYNSTTCNRNSFQCPSLARAVFIAVSNDSIKVMPGNYTGRENLDLCIAGDACNFRNVSLHGMGPPDQIVINGNVTFVTRALYIREFTFTEISNLTYTGIRNLTVLNELPAEPDTLSLGGSAISVSFSRVRITNVHFLDNAAAVGAALRLYNSDVYLTNCVFANNYANYAGGAISADASNISIINNDFRWNNATASSAEASASGGAIYYAGASSHHFTVTRSRFVNNLAQHFGGAILVKPNAVNRGPQYVTVTHSYFQNNVADGGGPCLSSTSCNAMGGALYLSVVTVTIESCNFIANSVLSSQSTKLAYGGAIFTTNIFGSRLRSTAKTTIHNCNFTNNFAFGAGGAVYGASQALDVWNGTFQGNYVTCENPSFTDAPTYGGAIWYSGNSGTNFVKNSSFVGNYAVSGWGGAIFGTESCQLDLVSSTFMDNKAISSYTNSGTGGAIMVSSGVNITVNHCYFRNNYASPELDKSPLAYSGSGGALFLQSSAVSILNSRFVYNKAFTGQFDSGSSGGAVTLEDCYPARISNSYFGKNGAAGFLGKSQYASCGTGGAIYIKFSSVNISQSIFSANWVSSGGSQNALGGAISIYFDYSSVSSSVDIGVRIRNSKFDNNTALGQLCNQLQAGQGGAIGLVGVSKPAVALENVEFTRNVAFAASSAKTLSAGGAIVATFTSNVTAMNCQFHGNAAVFGGGDDVSSLANDGGEQNHLYFSNCSFNALHSNLLKTVSRLLSDLSGQLCAKITSLSRRRLVDTYLSVDNLSVFPAERQFNDWHRDYRLYQLANDDDNLHLNVFGSFVPLSRQRIDALLQDQGSEEGEEDDEGEDVDDDEATNARKKKELTYLIEALEKYIPQSNAKGKDVEMLDRLIQELREEQAKYSSDALAVVTREQMIESELREYEQSHPLTYNRARRMLQSEINTNIFSTLLNVQPDIVIAGGSAIFKDPIFTGTYHVFFGDFQTYNTIESTGVDTDPNSVYSSVVDMVGNITSEDLIVTVLLSRLRIIENINSSTMIMKILNVFNGTLSFANDIHIKNTSFLYESTIQGLTGAYELVHQVPVSERVRPSNISFLGTLITGYPLKDLLQNNQLRLRNVLKKLSSDTTSNSSAQSVITFIDCNLVVAGLMTVDSPYRGIFQHSTKMTESLTDFPNSKIILNNNATMTIARGGTLNIVTSTIILGDSLTRDVVYNSGNISLVGTTKTFLSREDISVGRSELLAEAGSLTSTLDIIGNVVQHPSGSFNIWLNNSYQTRPVLNLVTNRTLQGSVNVQFYTGDDFSVCPNLVLYDTSPSAFQIITIDEPVAGEDRLRVNAPPGLEFLKKTYSKEVTIPSEKTFTIYNNVLTVSNIGCDYIFDYYDDVKTSVGTGSLFPCHVCLSNNTCEYCNGDSCAVRGQCGSAGVQYSSDCCAHDCGPYGDCEPSSGYTSFSCQCNNWFYEGNDCRDLTISAIIVILTACFLVVVFIIVFLLYRRSVVQKAKVLEELREGILRHTESANNEYIQNMQQALILNDVFVKYEEIKIESKIGEGSFGVVYKATFRGAQVAVKQMRSMFFELTDKEIDEFRKEAYMMSRLRHPNIVLVMGISLNEQEILPMKSRAKKSEDPELLPARSVSSDKRKEKEKASKPQKTVCIITEYLEQGSLADILYGPTKLPAEIWTYELILTCALQAARGMLYLHSHQPPICHRDLKSSNLVVDDHWVVKVTDFGMSRIVPETVQDFDKGIDAERESIGRNSFMDPSALEGSGSIMVPPSTANTSSLSAPSKGAQTTNTSSLGLEMTSNLGTTAWCAPEILTSSSRTRYSVKVDVYSFGLVLWELWEKKRPFDEYTSRFDIIDAVRAGKRPAISESCPPTFKALIQRCWQAEPSRRPTMNYIVRYLKDELGRVKRNKTTANNPTATNRLTMSSYFRTSMSAPPVGASEPPSARSSMSRKSAMFAQTEEGNNGAFHHDDGRPSMSQSLGDPTTTSHLAITNPMIIEGKNNGNIPSNVNNNGASAPPPPLNTSDNADNLSRDPSEVGRPSMSRESLKNLPEGRTPLVRAVDRSLSYLTESPSMSSPLTSNYYKYGGGAWRDRYVMKFSGWNSANPDAGLPPSARQQTGGHTPPGTSPLTSFVSEQSVASTASATRRPSTATAAATISGTKTPSAVTQKAAVSGTPESEADLSNADEHAVFVMDTPEDTPPNLSMASRGSASAPPSQVVTSEAVRGSVTESLLHSSTRTSHQRRFSQRDSQDKQEPR